MRAVYLLAIVTLSFASGGAAAELSSFQKAAARCAEVESGVERLACFDRLVAEQGLVRKVEPVPQSGNWSVSKETSKVDDSTNVFMRIRANEEVEKSRLWKGYPRLWIACRENKTSFFVTYPFFITTQSARVTYRFDKQKAKTRTMSMSTDYKAFGFWSGGSSIPFIKSMFGKSQLLIRVIPHGESAVTSEFNIGGLQGAIAPLRKACDW